jgi:hypothetical protein
MTIYVEIAIGSSLPFALLRLVSSSLAELVASACGLRAGMLREAIRGLCHDRRVVARLHAHALTQGCRPTLAFCVPHASWERAYRAVQLPARGRAGRHPRDALPRAAAPRACSAPRSSRRRSSPGRAAHSSRSTPWASS